MICNHKIGLCFYHLLPVAEDLTAEEFLERLLHWLADPCWPRR